ncbi:MAG: hypothetical protein ACK4LQ_04180 [Pararhodobacter sp.]
MPRLLPFAALAALLVSGCMSDPDTMAAQRSALANALLQRADMSTEAVEIVLSDGSSCTLPHRGALRPGTSWHDTIADCPFTRYQISIAAEPPESVVLIAPTGTAPLYPDLGLPFGWASLWLYTDDDGPWILEGPPMMLHSDGGPG